jgi:steroid delta-isomerase-like uncharacterized protein
MSTELNKATTRKWLLEAFNNYDLSLVEECLTEDYINHGTTEVRGYEGGRQVLTQAQAWAPDGKIVVHSMVAEGDTVMVLFTFEGTHTGALGDIPANGKQFSFLMVDVFKFRDGKISEAWVIRDRMEIQEQLGILHGISASR